VPYVGLPELYEVASSALTSISKLAVVLDTAFVGGDVIDN
jgi:hypothetical protein